MLRTSDPSLCISKDFHDTGTIDLLQSLSIVCHADSEVFSAA